MVLAALIENLWPTLLAGIGVAMLVGAAAAGAGVMGSARAQSPMRRGVAHWIPIAGAALAFAVMGRPQTALAIVFGTSVAAISAGVGMALLNGSAVELTRRQRPMFLLMPVAAILIFIAGFSGSLVWKDAVALLVQGAMIAYVWRDPGSTPPARLDERPGLLAVVVALAAGGAAGFAAWATARGIGGFDIDSNIAPLSSMVSIILSLCLLAPVILTSASAAHHGDTAGAVSTHVSIAVLNVCALAPLVFFTCFARSWALDPAAAGMGEWLRTRASLGSINSFASTFPLSLWQVDGMALIILSLALVPAAAGRLKLDRWVGASLVAAYCVYILMIMLREVRR